MNMRNMLAQQLSTQQDNRDSEMRKDNEILKEANRMKAAD